MHVFSKCYDPAISMVFVSEIFGIMICMVGAVKWYNRVRYTDYVYTFYRLYSINLQEFIVYRRKAGIYQSGIAGYLYLPADSGCLLMNSLFIATTIIVQAIIYKINPLHISQKFPARQRLFGQARRYESICYRTVVISARADWFRITPKWKSKKRRGNVFL